MREEKYFENIVLKVSFRMCVDSGAGNTVLLYADGNWTYDKNVLSISFQDFAKSAHVLVKKPATVLDQLLEQSPIFKTGLPFQCCRSIPQAAQSLF
jgi:hypothetical protein